MEIISIISVLFTIGFAFYVGAPAYVIVLIILGLGSPLICSIGILLNKE